MTDEPELPDPKPVETWGLFEKALATFVSFVWAAALIGGFGTDSERLFVQAAMMTILGAVFGKQLLRPGGDR